MSSTVSSMHSAGPVKNACKASAHCTCYEVVVLLLQSESKWLSEFGHQRRQKQEVLSGLAPITEALFWQESEPLGFWFLQCLCPPLPLVALLPVSIALSLSGPLMQEQQHSQQRL